MIRKHAYFFLLNFLLIFILSFKFSIISFAHPGGGPPFLKINNTYAITDSYSPRAEDLAPQLYTKNETLVFSIDTQSLGVPDDIVKNSTLRWTINGDTKNYRFGKELSYRFTQEKTHFVTLEVKGPTDQNFIILDHIRIHIVPSKDYKVPHVSIAIETDKYRSEKPIVFISKTSSENVTYEWEFGNRETSTLKNPIHIYKDKNFSYLASVKVTDSKGYISYSSIIVTGLEGELSFQDPVDPSKKIDIKPSYSSSQIAKESNNSWGYILFAIITLACFTICFIVWFKKKKS